MPAFVDWVSGGELNVDTEVWVRKLGVALAARMNGHVDEKGHCTGFTWQWYLEEWGYLAPNRDLFAQIHL